jgi:hypothetical protein
MDLGKILGIGGLVVLAIAYNAKLIPIATNPSSSVMVSRGSGGY